jgi:hypothetical protein
MRAYQLRTLKFSAGVCREEATKPPQFNYTPITRRTSTPIETAQWPRPLPLQGLRRNEPLGRARRHPAGRTEPAGVQERLLGLPAFPWRDDIDNIVNAGGVCVTGLH